ncbi:HAMP domain-containing protein [Leucobacter insecticola]|uniref:histidine kinase n=1 Tax=Leucobacter insecticola TaxID=2714934 RepID=A0A6G8FJZ3_9MICO|nr:HAMP domain-containing sensor histidine kinase [Leucobacter insecticola]QIM16674.1 HAMP domain-containing protein [Leucobacter insecticola]
MRRRIIVVFLLPVVLMLLAISGAYGWSAARSNQQNATTQLLRDLSYFVPGVRQALQAEDPSIIKSELDRYASLYGSRITVYDRSGTAWVSSVTSSRLSGTSTQQAGSDVAEQVGLALSGRRSDPIEPSVPWNAAETVIVEPVFDDDSVIGAVQISASLESSQRAILTQWSMLFLGGVIAIMVLTWTVYWLASWVLRPLHRVDAAMAAIESGEMGARIADNTGPPEVQRMVRMFNQMAEEIERVMTRQQEFVFNASHELRNPLGALLLRVEFLATGLDESWDEAVESTREEGRRMTRILDTLLNMARVGKTDSAFAAVDLQEIIVARVEAWRDRGVEQQVMVLASEGSPKLSVTDRTGLESALDAIIDNALKFAPPDTSVEVAVTEHESEYVITVRDRGRGLDTRQLELATDRFWRSSLDQNVAGTGLGLAIASDLMDTLGGRIVLESPQGGGLQVALCLPIDDSKQRPIAEKADGSHA